jgi:hypothetical protein
MTDRERAVYEAERILWEALGKWISSVAKPDVEIAPPPGVVAAWKHYQTVVNPSEFRLEETWQCAQCGSIHPLDGRVYGCPKTQGPCKLSKDITP